MEILNRLSVVEHKPREGSAIFELGHTQKNRICEIFMSNYASQSEFNHYYNRIEVIRLESEKPQNCPLTSVPVIPVPIDLVLNTNNVVTPENENSDLYYPGPTYSIFPEGLK